MRAWWLLTGLVGCAVPAYSDPIGTDDSDLVADSDTDGDTDTDADSDPFVDPGDTGWLVDELDTDVIAGGGGPPLGCHPYDPIESAGWVRRYQATFGRNNGNERHDGMGLETLPNWASGTYAEAYGYTVKVTGAGNADNDGHVWFRCDVQGDAQYELAWLKQIQTGILGRTTVQLRAKARQARKVLPSEVEMSGRPSWSGVTRYDLTQVGGVIGGQAQAELKHDGTYVSFGFESVTVPLGSFQNAYHINVLYAEEKIENGGLFEAFFGIFDDLFGALFGFDQGSATINAQADRWYVRGIGLVKEETIDSNDGSLIVRKELRSCSGLPGCP